MKTGWLKTDTTQGIGRGATRHRRSARVPSTKKTRMGRFDLLMYGETRAVE